MIAVQVGEKYIHPVPVHTDRFQLPFHGFPARFLAKTRIHQQTPGPQNQIAIERLERISHQGNLQPPQILRKLLRHPIHLLSGALYQIFHRVSSRMHPRENPPQRLSFTVGSDRINNTFNNGGTYP